MRVAFRQVDELVTRRATAREAMVRGAIAAVRFNGSGSGSGFVEVGSRRRAVKL